jgi:hypothetical protein
MEGKTLTGEDVMRIASMLSDVQEEISGDYGNLIERATGKINLIKGFLFGQLDMVSDDGFFWEFKSKLGEKSRFCDHCGLLKPEHQGACKCPGVA